MLFVNKLILSAILAFSANSKLSTQSRKWYVRTDLSNVDFDTLEREKMQEYLDSTQEQYEAYKLFYAKQYLYTNENIAHHIIWLKSEATIQALNKKSEYASFAHNERSDWTHNQIEQSSGVKVPKDEERIHNKVNLELYGRFQVGFEIQMDQEEYQNLYNAEWAKSPFPCVYFDEWFMKQDKKFMAAQEQLQWNFLFTNKGMTVEKFNPYWEKFNIERQFIRKKIHHCYDVDDEIDQMNPIDECNKDLVAFKWGTDVVAEIKEQGTCGSGYAFAANMVLESALAIATGDLVQNFSEQQVIDCQNDYDSCYGCRGGWPYRLHESSKVNPIALQSNYAYTGKEGHCRNIESNHHAAASEVYWVDPTPAAIKKELCHGPISAVIQASGAFSYFNGGVLTSDDCPFSKDQFDHAVGIIGWTTLSGVEAMIVRNSWGTDWGEKGYAFLALDTGNKGWGPCGIYQYISSANVNLDYY